MNMLPVLLTHCCVSYLHFVEVLYFAVLSATVLKEVVASWCKQGVIPPHHALWEGLCLHLYFTYKIRPLEHLC